MSTFYRCNLCGKNMDTYDVRMGARMKYVSNFGSRFDGEPIRIDFCQKCADALIEKCKLPPFIEDSEFEED